MTKHGITNWKTFEKEMRKHGFYAEGFLDDISFKMSEDCVFDENGNQSFEVETGRKNTYGSLETISFDLVRYGKLNEDDDVVQEPLIRYTGIY
ncbi:MAG: hypothetical protein IJ735_02020 [Clostridia bacterium]|nr:hypothetical protein [Clostridia bacterium]